MSDAQIVALVLNGDRDAFGILVERCTARIYRLCLSICRDRYIAEEATQEAFIDAYLHLRSLSDPDSFESWLGTIARRKCFRMLSTRRADEDIDDLDEYLVGASSPEDSVLAEERRLTVRRAIAKLSPILRRTIEQFYIEGLSVKTIASRDAIPEATVKSRLFEGRNKLRKELAHMKEINSTPDLVAKIREKLDSAKFYYAIHSGFTGLDAVVDDTMSMISQLEDGKTKQFFLASALTLKACVDKPNSDQLGKAALEAAEAGENVSIIVSDLVDKFIEIDNNSSAKAIEFIDNTALPKLKPYLSTPEGRSGEGILKFWRGRANISLGKADDALADLTCAVNQIEKKDSYYANSVAALDQVRNFVDKGIDIKNGFGATAEGLVIDGDRLIFGCQPGFGGGLWFDRYKAKYDSIDYFAACAKRTLFDTSMKVGDTITEDEVVMTVVSYDDTISVPAGQFENCLHTRITGIKWYGEAVFDIYFAKGVGVVMAEINEPKYCEAYELTSYTINGGSGYFPFAVGNRWAYTNPYIPDWLYQRHEKRVEYFDGKVANLSCIDTFTLAPNFNELIKGDSDGCLSVADIKAENWELEKALELLKAGVRANSSERAVKICQRGVDTLKRFVDFQKKGYRFCPSSIGMSGITRDDGKVKSDMSSYYDFGPYRLGRRGRYEDRIFGMKPHRFQQYLFGRIWDDAWTVGYTEESKHDGFTAKLTVSDGGRVETSAGIFENCRLVTIEAEVAGAKDEKYYFANHYKYIDCGTKRYWYAPGVGIVRIVSDWGSTCHSETELVAYNCPVAEDSDYLPIQLGNKWEWAETECEKDGYHARCIIEVASGIDSTYQLTQAQEFVWLGKEDVYNNLPQSH